MTSFQIQVPQDYFAKSARRDYTDAAGMALIREFAQNAADAGATLVDFSFSSGHVLRVTDNGRGCDAGRVQRAILTPLGSEKEAESIGGFGKAKELLFYGNAQWSITTQDVRVKGSYLTVESFEQGHAHYAGFIAEVTLPADLYTCAYNEVRRFLAFSERPGVTWTLNGSRVDLLAKRAKRAAKDFGFAKAYVDPDAQDNWVYLRTGGLLTATRWGGHAAEVGRVIIEVTKPSHEVLTPARDWFATTAMRTQVESWLNQLVTDARQTLAETVGDEILFEDYEVPTTASEATATVSSRDAVPNVNGVNAEVTFRSAVAQAEFSSGEASARALPAGTSTGAAGVATGVSSAPARIRRRDDFDMSLMPRLAEVRRVTVHTGGKKQAGVAMRWLRKNPEVAQRMLAAWYSAVHAIAQRTGLPVDAVGFTFSTLAEAEYVRAQGRFALLLNPMKFDYRAVDAADELLDRALHETAHLVNGTAHDEAFVQAEFTLRRKTRGSTVRGTIARALRTSAVATLEEA